MNFPINKKELKTRSMSFKVTEESYQNFKKACCGEKMPMAHVIESLMQLYASACFANKDQRHTAENNDDIS